jgi:protein-L-isoaspartate(D-aspartate) O-methyltransferase
MPDYSVQRTNMTVSQLLPSGVTDEPLLEAFREMPRERFVPQSKREIAYADAPVEVVHGRWLLAPAVSARLFQLAEITPSDSVLDVGCLTGYSTAILARVSARAVGLEEDAELVRGASERVQEMRLPNALIVQGSLAQGHRAIAPYDVIVVNGGIEAAPKALLAQLAEDGRLVAIWQHDVQGQAVLYRKRAGQIENRLAFDASAPILRAFREPAGFVF